VAWVDHPSRFDSYRYECIEWLPSRKIASWWQSRLEIGAGPENPRVQFLYLLLYLNSKGIR